MLIKNLLCAALLLSAACGGAVGSAPDTDADAEPVAFCPGEHMDRSMVIAAENLELDFVIDCEAPEAVHVIWDGPLWDSGRCGVDPEAVCVASCTVEGECAMPARIETALLAAGL